MRRIGIMGGTFDPIHIGHLVTAEAARHEFSLQRVFFVPSGNPPHKQSQNVSKGEHRYLMTLLATAANPAFYLSRAEIDRSGYSYTYDTVRLFLRDYAPCELYFITGADAILDITSWHNYQQLLQICHFVAATRPGFRLEQHLNRQSFTAEQLAHIHYIEIPSLAISSTDIRRRVREGRPISYLVPEGVEHYIHKHRLYIDS
ncbi:MAG: nicotinate-nucleotide adenylyltransferase [Bacillota bacterium]|jgi:nicotinate-nucleotide adenylyltransferase